MVPMTDYITYREVREVTVRLPGDDCDPERSYDEDIVEAVVVSREEIGRRHEIDYAWECDLDAGLFYLRADGERIFSSRSHDAIIVHAQSLGDDISGTFMYGDLEDQEKFWRTLAELPPKKESRPDGACA